MKYLKVFVDFAEKIELLGDAERGRLFTAMLEYAKSGANPELKGNEKFIWPTAKSEIDRQVENYESICAINKRIATERNAPSRSVTKRNEPSQDKDKDKDKDKEYTGDNARTRVEPTETAEIPFSGELREAVNDWLRYKRERREAYKPTGLKSLITQIERASELHGEAAVIGVIRDSMSSGYKGIMLDRLQAKKPQESAFRRVLREEYAKAAAEEGRI